MRTSNFYSLAGCAGLALLLLAGCDNTIAPSAPRILGAIDVAVATTFADGDYPDRDSFLSNRVMYNLGIDGGTGPLIIFNGRERVSPITTGTHAVKLYGLPYNCLVDGENPATVEVSPTGLVGSLNFSVVCSAPQTGGWDY